MTNTSPDAWADQPDEVLATALDVLYEQHLAATRK